MKRALIALCLAATVLVVVFFFVFISGPSRQVQQIAFATGYEMGRKGQANVFDNFRAEDAARDPESFFAAVAMGVPGMSNGAVKPELETTLQRMAKAEPAKRSVLIRIFGASFKNR